MYANITTKNDSKKRLSHYLFTEMGLFLKKYTLITFRPSIQLSYLSKWHKLYAIEGDMQFYTWK